MQDSPCGVVSLLEMLEFHAESFVHEFSGLGAIEIRCGQESQAQMKPAFLENVHSRILSFGGYCARHSFKSSAQQCVRIHNAIEESNGVMTCGRVGDELRDLRKRFEDDVKSELFFHLSLEEASLYGNPWDKWEGIVKRFEETTRDIEEMNKCFAFGRYTASMFHALHVAEWGSIKLGDYIGVTDPKKGVGAYRKKA